MNRQSVSIPILLVVVALLAAPGPAPAQSYIFANIAIEDACSGDRILLDLTMTVTDAVPEEYVGWVVQRRVVGKCVDPVLVGGVRDFPLDATTIALTDTPDEPGYAVLYKVFAVDAEGVLHDEIFYGSRTRFAFVSCSGPAASGVVVAHPMGADLPYLEVCPDACWLDLSPWDDSLPEGFGAEMIGRGVILYGDMYQGMHGGVIIDPQSWTLTSGECAPVAHESVDWSRIKAVYR